MFYRGVLMYRLQIVCVAQVLGLYNFVFRKQKIKTHEKILPTQPGVIFTQGGTQGRIQKEGG